jgi:phosphoglycerol transferase MdoB-like AlkP superfamily enzyme
VGTHGSKLAPHLPMSDRQKIEIQFRVPIALISKNIKNPRIFYEVVHQVDLAPTLAKIAGISSKVSWVGSGLLSGPGRPFVYHGPHQFAYRTQSKSCYQWTGKNELRCWRVSEKDDPLFSLNLEETHEEPELSSFFKKVVHSNRQAITLNRLKEK